MEMSWRSKAKGVLGTMFMSGLAGAMWFGLYSLMPTRQEQLEHRMADNVYITYAFRQDVCQKVIPKFPKESVCNALLIQGDDSTKRYTLRNDIKVMAGVFKEQGCYVVSVCADVHSKEQVLTALDDLVEKSAPGKQSELFYTGHGDKAGTLAYNGLSSSKNKDATATAKLTKMDLDARLIDYKGTINLYFDNCYAIPELSKGMRVDSSDSENPSFFASYVDMSYFTMVLVYTWNQHKDKYTSLVEVAADLAKKDASLPDDVKELMGYREDAFDSITVHQESALSAPVCERIEKTPISPLFSR